MKGERSLAKICSMLLDLAEMLKGEIDILKTDVELLKERQDNLADMVIDLTDDDTTDGEEEQDVPTWDDRDYVTDVQNNNDSYWKEQAKHNKCTYCHALKICDTGKYTECWQVLKAFYERNK